PVDDDLAVEAAGPQQRRVEDVGPVGGRDEDDAGAGVEPVHLDEQLVEGLLALVVAAAHAGTAVAPDGVDLVDEDDGRRVLLRLFEQVAHAAGAHAHEHLDEVRPRDRVERNVRLTSDRAREKGLAGSGRAIEQHTLRDARAHGLEPCGVGEELLDLVQLFDRLVGTGDVVEGDLWRLLRHEFGLRLAELHDLASAALHARHEEPEDEADDDERDDEPEHRGEPAAVVDLVVVALQARVVDGLDHVGAASGCVVELNLLAVLTRLLQHQVDALLTVDDLRRLDLVVI